MLGSLQIRVVGQEIRAVKFTRSMAPQGACAHLGYQSPKPRYPSAGAGPTKQDRPPSTPAQSEGPLRGPPRRGSPRSTTRRSRPPRHHPPPRYSSTTLCPRTASLYSVNRPEYSCPRPPLRLLGSFVT